ncbi:unnamed protein product [Cuscuta campestris]|uniref:FAS1 domain-containing protein n=1 Tax=Cuscuta campestris TaxID=132261 RepID=A0A484MQM5_9ASTE|nr:unnamed protein product [Cuscuta campestris]
MASSTSRFIADVLLIVILNQSDSVSAVQTREMDSILTALRSNGYGLFSNAIITSDLWYDLVDGREAALAVFAPTDSSLFALDMVNSAFNYTATLRCHVVPHRLSVRGLNRIRPDSSLRTLAADHDLRVESRRSTPDVLVRQPETPRSEPPGGYSNGISLGIQSHHRQIQFPCLTSLKKRQWQSTNFSIDNSSMDVNPSGESFNLTPSPSIDLSKSGFITD